MKKLILVLLSLQLVACLKVKKKSETIVNDPEVISREEPISEESIHEKTPEREPIVFKISESVSLSDNLEIVADEIYIGAGVQIYTNQFSLKLISEKIIIDNNVVISNFGIGNINADFMQNGLSGGNIEIRSELIKGQLKIILNAQNGSPGIGGWFIQNYDLGGPGGSIVSLPPEQLLNMNEEERLEIVGYCNAGNGFNAGNSGSLLISSENSENFYLLTQMSLAQAGSIGNMKEIGRILRSELNYYKSLRETNCNEKPVPGQPGKSGTICKKLKRGDSPQCS